MTRLGFIQCGINAVDRPGGDAGGGQILQPPGCCLARHGGLDRRQQGDPVHHPRLVGGIIRIVGKPVEPGDLTEFAELRIIADSKDDVAVSGGKSLIGHDVGMGIAKPSRCGAGDQIVQCLIRQAGNADIEQAHIDMLPATGALRMHHGGQNGGGGVGAGQHIDKGDADLHRHAVSFAGDAHQPAHALNHEIIAGARRVRAILSEAGDRAIDKSRVDGAERGVIEPIFGKPANLEILHQNIRFTHKLAQDIRPFRRRDVDGKRALVAVD